ncbi:MAG: hypothetical protein ACTHK9_05690 [Nitrobacter sp.]|jgi:hypothetical protein|nr:hypothetical protein [Nitrobacter sp. 62-13]
MNDFFEWRSSMREFEGTKKTGRRNAYIIGALLVLLFIAFIVGLVMFQ